MKGSTGNLLRQGILLPVVIVVLAAAAAVAAGKFVIGPASTASVSNPSASSGKVSSASGGSSAGSSSGSSSSGTASAAASADYLNDAIFIGDSITAGFEQYNVAVTAGVFTSNAMTSANALTTKVTLAGKTKTLSAAVDAVNPGKIYVMVGSNDATWMTASRFSSNYKKLIEGLVEAAPTAKIYVQSVLPVTAAYEKKSKISNNTIEDFNAALEKLCTEEKVYYVDVAAKMKGSDGALPSSLSSDGLNLKAGAYSTWLDVLLANEK